MVPDMQGALTLYLAQDTVCSACEMMRNLENIGNLVGNGDGEDEEIYGSQ
jgi:hypothetical protein